jgi:hypothetical protein
MLMRFRGGGVGHKSTREATAVFLEDRDPLDKVSVAQEDAGEDTSSEDNSEIRGHQDSDSDHEELAQLDTRVVATTQNQDMAEEGEMDDAGESEIEEYGYGGLDDSESETDNEGDEEQADNGVDEVIDNELGPEDGEDDVEDEYEGYAEL